MPPLLLLSGCAMAADQPEFERWYVGEAPYDEDLHASYAEAEDEESVQGAAVVTVDDQQVLSAVEADDETDELLPDDEVDEGADDDELDDVIYFDDEDEDFDSDPEVDFFAAANPPALTSSSEAHSAWRGTSVRGDINRVRFSGWVAGWACDRRTPNKSVDVILTLRNRNGKKLERIRVKAGKRSGARANSICGGGRAHRFSASFKRKQIPCGARVGLKVVGKNDEKTFVHKRKLRCNPIGETFKIKRSGKITGWACDLNKPKKRSYVSVVRSKGKNRKKRTNVKHGAWVRSRCSGGAKKHRFKFNVPKFKCGEKVRVYSHNLGKRGRRRTLIGKRNMPNCNPGARNHRRPVRGPISSHYGMRWHPISFKYKLHAGTDFAAPRGRVIRASQSGRVTFRGWTPGGGRVVQIYHGKGVSTRYLHMSKFHVKHGQKVTKGQRIGRVGSTGSSTAPHLHFEYHKNGFPLNPLKILP